MEPQQVRIFIGYRRCDSQGFAGRVADDLIDCFGTAQVFRDDDIPEGSDFTFVLEGALNHCSVLIAVIGPSWLTAADADGTPRIFQSDDWVRRELETAIERGIRVLPVLVGNASMPSSKELPDSIASIANVQAVRMSDRSWERDLERLISLLIEQVPSLTLIPHHQRTSESTPSIEDILEKLGSRTFPGQPVRRTPANRIISTVGKLLIRALWLSVLLLLAWYVFDNHATPEFRQFVFDFLSFAQDKILQAVSLFKPA